MSVNQGNRGIIFKTGDKVRHTETVGLTGTIHSIWHTANHPYEVKWSDGARTRHYGSELTLIASETNEKIHTRLGAHGWIGSYNAEINRWIYTRGTGEQGEYIELYSDVAYYTQGKRSLRGTHEEIVSLCGEAEQTSALVRKTIADLDEWRKHFGDTTDWMFARAVEHLYNYVALLEERGE